MLFSVKVSIIHVIWKRLLLVFLFTTLLTAIYLEIDTYHYFYNYLPIPLYLEKIELPTVDFLPASFIGFVIALYLGFANTTAYDRWWEARKQWGALVNTTRTLTRQILVLINGQEITDEGLKQDQIIKKIQEDIIKNIIAFVYLLKNNLRHVNDNKKEMELYLQLHEIEHLINQYNKQNALLVIIEKKINLAYRKGYINTYIYNLLSKQIAELTNIMGACERINTTPIPYPYKVLLNRLVVIFTYALPFSLVSTEGIFTPLVILLMAYALFGLAALIDELEMPFGYESNDLPLDAIARKIEIDLLQMMGEQELPDYKTPDKNGILT